MHPRIRQLFCKFSLLLVFLSGISGVSFENNAMGARIPSYFCMLDLFEGFSHEELLEEFTDAMHQRLKQNKGVSTPMAKCLQPVRCDLDSISQQEKEICRKTKSLVVKETEYKDYYLMFDRLFTVSKSGQKIGFFSTGVLCVYDKIREDSYCYDSNAFEGRVRKGAASFSLDGDLVDFAFQR